MRSGPKQDVQGERKKKEKEKKASKKPEAQMRGNRQNMQSGINGYSRRLIEGLGSFGRPAKFFVQFFDKQQQQQHVASLGGHAGRTCACGSIST